MNNIKKLRQKKRLSARELGLAIGKSQSTISKWEKKEQPLHYIFCNADGYPGGYEPTGVTEWSPGQEISDSDATILLIKIDLSKTMYDGSEIRIPVFRGTHSV